MNPVAPGVAEGLDHFRLLGHVLAVLDVRRCGGPLEVGIELDAVGRIEIDALHFAAEAFLLGKRSHHLQGIAEDHPVRPVLLVMVEVHLVDALRDAVEVREQRHLFRRGRSPRPTSRLLLQIVDDRLRVNLLLYEDRHRLDREIVRVLRVLALPHELRVKVGIARIPERDRRDILLRDEVA